MNTRTASLLTALLFLATPLAFTPTAAAPGAGGPLNCGPTAPGVDPVYLAACTVLSAAGATAFTEDGKVVDVDHDGRADAAVVTDDVTAPIWWEEPIHYVIQIDYFFTDSNPATNDEPYSPTGLAGAGGPGQFDIALDPTLRVDCFDSAGSICEVPVYSGGYFRLSNHFSRQVPFTDGRLHSAETYDIAIYTPGTPSRFYSGPYGGDPSLVGQGVCLLCVKVSSMRIVFGAGTYDGFVLTQSPVEGIIDVDAAPGDASIQGAHGPYVAQFRAPVGRTTGGQGPTFYDGKKLNFQEAFIKTSGEDIDDDGFDSGAEFSCNSNPTNPISTCDDVDGDRIANDVDGDPFVPAGDIDADLILDTLDNCPTVANHDQANWDDASEAVKDGDACTDTDADGVLDALELSGESNIFCTKQVASVSVKKADGCPADEPSATDSPKSGATLPGVPDSDGDNLNDGAELGVGGHVVSDPNNADSDHDLLADDADEALAGSPVKADTDADGFRDNVDNCVPNANVDQSDVDADGKGDVCASGSQKEDDIDGDGISNGDEDGKTCTDKTNPDTDGDGLTDKQEIDTNFVDGANGPVKVYVECKPAGAVGPVPTPAQPPVYPFLSPLKADSYNDGVNDAPADLVDPEPSLVPNVAVALNGVPATSPVGTVGLVDEYDPYDINADGAGNQYNEATGKYQANDKQGNGQVDIVERNVAYYNPDESTHPAGYAYSRFEGDNGITLTAFNNADGRFTNPTTGASTASYLRLGDVHDTDLREVVVVEGRGALVCVAWVDGRATLFTNGVGPAPYQAFGGSNPCGKPSTSTGELASLPDPFGPLYANPKPTGPWIIVTDADGDGSPDSVSIRHPDTCAAGPPPSCTSKVDPIPVVNDPDTSVVPYDMACTGAADAVFPFCEFLGAGAPLRAIANTATGNPPYQGRTGTSIALNGGGSGGAPATPGAYTCTWSFASAPAAATSSALTNANQCAGSATPASVVYGASGKHYLILTVSDGPNQATRSVLVTAKPPMTASAGGPYSGQADTPIAVLATAQNPVGAVSCIWTAEGATVANDHACATTLTYSTTGSKEISVEVKDSGGANQQTVTAVDTVTVSPPPPPAAIDVDANGPYKGYSGTDIAIAATVTHAVNTAACTWSGTDATFGDATACSTTVSFATGGAKTISVSVQDGADDTRIDSDTATVNVKELESMPGSGYTGDVNVPIAIVGSARNATAADVTCAWSSAGATFADASACSTTVTYATAGSKSLSLQVSNGTVTATNSTTVTVNPEAAYAAQAGGPYSGAPGAAIAITGSANRAPGSYTCAWSGDGATFADASACSTTVTFDEVGEKTITLTATHGTDVAADEATVDVAEPEAPACDPDNADFPACLGDGTESPVEDCTGDENYSTDPIVVCILPEGGLVTGPLGLPGVHIRIPGVLNLPI